MCNSSVFSSSSTLEVLLKSSRIINIVLWFLLTVRITQKIPPDWSMQLKFHKGKKKDQQHCFRHFPQVSPFEKKSQNFIFWISKMEDGVSYWVVIHFFLRSSHGLVLPIAWPDELLVSGEVELSCYQYFPNKYLYF